MPPFGLHWGCGVGAPLLEIELSGLVAFGGALLFSGDLRGGVVVDVVVLVLVVVSVVSTFV